MSERDDWDEDEQDGVEAVLKDVRTQGVRVAYDTAVEICRDQKAPAPARATALNAIFRVAGLYEAKEDPADQRPDSELTAAELARRSEKARLRVEALERQAAQRAELSIFD